MTIKMESFAAAHAGRCPGCGMNDNGNHITHRYGALFTEDLTDLQRSKLFARYAKYLQTDLLEGMA